MIFLVIGLSLLATATSFLFFRAAKKLLEFEQLLADIATVLTHYSMDLSKMSSGDVLLDSPEIAKFHRRNLEAVADILKATKQIGEVAPRKGRKPLPQPDVE